jgi:hypothetical protein
MRKATVLSWSAARRKRMAALLRLKVRSISYIVFSFSDATPQEYAESMDAEQLASFPPLPDAPRGSNPNSPRAHSPPTPRAPSPATPRLELGSARTNRKP